MNTCIHFGEIVDIVFANSRLPPLLMPEDQSQFWIQW